MTREGEQGKGLRDKRDKDCRLMEVWEINLMKCDKTTVSDWTEAREVLAYFIGLCLLSPVSFRSLQAHLQMPKRHSTLLIRVHSLFFSFFKKSDEGHWKKLYPSGLMKQ